MKGRIKRRRLGRTELFVSELSYGAMNLRLLDTIDEACEILDYVSVRASTSLILLEHITGSMATASL